MRPLLPLHVAPKEAGFAPPGVDLLRLWVSHKKEGRRGCPDVPTRADKRSVPLGIVKCVS